MTDTVESEKVWEKCARLLMLNSIEKLATFLETVRRVLESINHAPGIPKFRTLKYSNASIANKVIEISGGVEFFHGLGFQTVADAENGKVLRLDTDDATRSEPETLENLNIGLQWLENTISTCRSCATSSTTGTSRSGCAECTIIVRLPTGASVSGGFMRGDKLHHIRSYACCYFTSQRSNAVRLVLPESRVEVTEALLDCTLEELGLCPRAVLFASIYSETEREALLSQKHDEQHPAQTGQKVQVKTEKKTKLDERQALKEERARILGAFKDDRSSSK